MKKLLLILYGLSHLNLFGQSTTAKKILFIGNSYTYGNNLPQLIKDVSLSTGNDIIYDSHLIGGSTLSMHSSDPTTIAKITEGSWDYVVLQEQSQLPAFPEQVVQTEVYPFATALNQLIENHNPCGETIFYMTWGRKNGDSSNCTYHPPMCTYTGMDDLLKNRYLTMAFNNNAITSPVGAVWRYIRTNFPSIELYEADESHPNIIGSYTAALTFYTTIFRKDPELVTFKPLEISSADASILKSAVKHVVYEQQSQWYIGAYDTVADFSTVPLSSPLSFQFNNNSSFAESYSWNFGDGSYSTLNNPVHTYSTPGIYTVTLTATRCGSSQTKSYTVNTDLLNSQEINTVTLDVFPNPVNDRLQIKNASSVNSYTIMDLSGRILTFGRYENYIDVKSLKEGIYYLKLNLKNNDKPYLIKFIKT